MVLFVCVLRSSEGDGEEGCAQNSGERRDDAWGDGALDSRSCAGD
jgi:hypothetical protein